MKDGVCGADSETRYRLTASEGSSGVEVSMEVQRVGSADWCRERVVDLSAMRSTRTVCEQLGLGTDSSAHGHVGGLLAGKIGANRFVAAYASDSRAKCRHFKCGQPITCGDLRIGKIPPSVKTGHSCRTQWYHLPCIFESFKKACKGTKVITNVNDVDFFDRLKPLDRDKLRAYVHAHNAHHQRNYYREDPPPPSPLPSSPSLPTPSSPPPPRKKKRKAFQMAADNKEEGQTGPPGKGGSKDSVGYGEELEGVVGLALLLHQTKGIISPKHDGD